MPKLKRGAARKKINTKKTERKNSVQKRRKLKNDAKKTMNKYV